MPLPLPPPRWRWVTISGTALPHAIAADALDAMPAPTLCGMQAVAWSSISGLVTTPRCATCWQRAFDTPLASTPGPEGAGLALHLAGVAATSHGPQPVTGSREGGGSDLAHPGHRPWTPPTPDASADA